VHQGLGKVRAGWLHEACAADQWQRTGGMAAAQRGATRASDDTTDLIAVNVNVRHRGVGNSGNPDRVVVRLPMRDRFHRLGRPVASRGRERPAVRQAGGATQRRSTLHRPQTARTSNLVGGA
jgi:hypothetical protein